MSVRIQLPTPRQVSSVLLCVVMTLIGLSLAGQCSKYLLGHPRLKGFVPTFYVDYEPTVPTWYSSAALGLAATLLALIAVAKYRAIDRFRFHWWGLAALLFLLSADEIAMVHELPIDPLRETYGAGGLLYYTWVVPGMVLVGAVAVMYLRFFLSLPKRTQRLFLLAAGTFVAGAIGVEMLSGAWADRFGEENLAYVMIITVEEFLEMLGVVVLIRALLEYICDDLRGLHVQFGATQGAY